MKVHEKREGESLSKSGGDETTKCANAMQRVVQRTSLIDQRQQVPSRVCSMHGAAATRSSTCSFHIRAQ